MSELVPDIFKRHIGTWQGNYIKTDRTGHFLRNFQGTFTVAIDGVNYHQENYYQYDDGSTLTLKFEGQFDQGILKLNSPSYQTFQAIAWDGGYNTIGFRVEKQQDNDTIIFLETIHLLTDTYRVRSTQEFKNQKFVGVNLIEETKIL